MVPWSFSSSVAYPRPAIKYDNHWPCNIKQVKEIQGFWGVKLEQAITAKNIALYWRFKITRTGTVFPGFIEGKKQEKNWKLPPSLHPEVND